MSQGKPRIHDHSRRLVLIPVGLLLVLSAACDATLESNLNEEQANRIVVALDGQGIHASKRRDDSPNGPSFAVHVASGDVAHALSVLQATALPARDQPTLASVFDGKSLVPTATEERARVASALAGELVRSLKTIDGVVDARVHVALSNPTPRPLDEADARPRASVMVKYEGQKPFDERAIRVLVSGAVQDMRPEDVAVVALRARHTRHAPRPAISTFGPIQVTRATAPAFKFTLGMALGLDVVLAILLALAMFRRRSEPTPDE